MYISFGNNLTFRFIFGSRVLKRKKVATGLTGRHPDGRNVVSIS